MSNPNWSRKGGRSSLHRQLEDFALEDCMTLEQYMRARAEEEEQAARDKPS